MMSSSTAVVAVSIFLVLVSSMSIHSSSKTMAPRKSITALDSKELEALRDAIRALVDDDGDDMDESDYHVIAGEHGSPGWYCPHGEVNFLQWHRGYINRFENALGIALPYWEWTLGNGLPAAFVDLTYVDVRGLTRSNPLLSTSYENQSTTRDPDPDFPNDDLRHRIKAAMIQTTFTDFIEHLEGAHNLVHGAVGGSMGLIGEAARDPIFWCHHLFVDRVWYEWQRAHPNATYPIESTDDQFDSTGAFSGSDTIADFAGWERHHPLPEKTPVKSELTPHLIVTTTNIPSTPYPAIVTIEVAGLTLSTSFNLGTVGLERNWTTNAHAVVARDVLVELKGLGLNRENMEKTATVHMTNLWTGENSSLTTTNVTLAWANI